MLDGHLRITADGRTVDLRPGGLVHLAARLPHAVEAVEASRLQLTMLDQQVSICAHCRTTLLCESEKAFFPDRESALDLRFYRWS